MIEKMKILRDRFTFAASNMDWAADRIKHGDPDRKACQAKADALWRCASELEAVIRGNNPPSSLGGNFREASGALRDLKKNGG